MFRIRRRRALLFICVACTGLVALLQKSGFVPLWEAELRARDALIVRYGKKSPPDPRLVYLAIDQASLSLDEALPEEIAASPALAKMKAGWPWSRDVYPLIIERLVASGARVVAFDLLFPTPHEGDEAFRAALDRHHERVVIGSNFTEADREKGSTSTYALPAETLVPQTRKPDDRVAYVNFWPDIDRVIVRRATYRTTASRAAGQPGADDDEILCSLSARILQKAGLEKQIPASLEPLPFRFAGPGAFPARPLYQIFVNKFWDGPDWRSGEFLRDKIVLVGPAGNWSKDNLETPFGLMPGAELHLNALNAALNNDFLSEWDERDVFPTLAAGLVALALGLGISHPFRRFLALTGAGGAIYGAEWLGFNLCGLQPPLLAPLLALAGSGLFHLAWEQALDRRERARTRRTLERYVSREIAHELLDNPESYLNSLGGARKAVTVLFSDVRGFTALSENTDGHRLVAQLNEYFREMVRIVFAHHGRLDKFIGDAVMADWGSLAGEGEAADARRAVRAALEMGAALEKLNAHWKTRGLPEFKIGIGINHGKAIVGNLGCEEKMEVSVIGDTVNLASRLEGISKEYSARIILSKSAAELVRDAFYLQYIDLVRVRGKTKPVAIYTVAAERGKPAEPGLEEYLAAYHEGIEWYRKMDFARAEEFFNRCLAIRSADPLALLYCRRCNKFRTNPPGEDWDGVAVMQS